MNDTFHSTDYWFDINYCGKPNANNYKQLSPIEVSDIGYPTLGYCKMTPKWLVNEMVCFWIYHMRWWISH